MSNLGFRRSEPDPEIRGCDHAFHFRLPRAERRFDPEIFDLRSYKNSRHHVESTAGEEMPPQCGVVIGINTQIGLCEVCADPGTGVQLGIAERVNSFPRKG